MGLLRIFVMALTRAGPEDCRCCPFPPFCHFQGPFLHVLDKNQSWAWPSLNIKPVDLAQTKPELFSLDHWTLP